MSNKNKDASLKTRAENIERLLGTSIRMQREALGMSQSSLSKALREYGFTLQQSAIAKIEKGTRPIKVSELIAIAHALGIPWQSLLLAPENYASFSRNPTERLQEIVDNESVMADSYLSKINKMIEQYGEMLGKINAAEQLIGRIKATDPQEIAKNVVELLDSNNPTTGDSK